MGGGRALKFAVMGGGGGGGEFGIGGGGGGGGSFNRSNNFCAIVVQMVGRIHEKSYLKCWNQELF